MIIVDCVIVTQCWTWVREVRPHSVSKLKNKIGRKLYREWSDQKTQIWLQRHEEQSFKLNQHFEEREHELEETTFTTSQLDKIQTNSGQRLAIEHGILYCIDTYHFVDGICGLLNFISICLIIVIKAPLLLKVSSHRKVVSEQCLSSLIEVCLTASLGASSSVGCVLWKLIRSCEDYWSFHLCMTVNHCEVTLIPVDFWPRVDSMPPCHMIGLSHCSLCPHLDTFECPSSVVYLISLTACYLVSTFCLFVTTRRGLT